MRKSWTVLHLQIMLHYHTRPYPYAEGTPHGCSGATLGFTKELVDLDMLARDKTGTLVTTKKGAAFVEALKRVCEPIEESHWRVELAND